jgi:hypothetical protein
MNHVYPFTLHSDACPNVDGWCGVFAYGGWEEIGRTQETFFFVPTPPLEHLYIFRVWTLEDFEGR